MSKDRIKTQRHICHPATAVMLWLFFMVWIMLVDTPLLLGLTGAVMLASTPGARQQWLRYVRRSRWLLLVLLLMHAYNLPGAPLWPALGQYGPSIIGAHAGLLQSWRLLLLLAVFALFMTRFSREALLVGIYTLLAPLRYVGLPAERIAMRLWLTMNYAESMLQDPQRISFKQRLLQLSKPQQVTAEMMQPLLLPAYRSGWMDYMMIVSVTLLGLWVR